MPTIWMGQPCSRTWNDCSSALSAIRNQRSLQSWRLDDSSFACVPLYLTNVIMTTTTSTVGNDHIFIARVRVTAPINPTVYVSQETLSTRGPARHCYLVGLRCRLSRQAVMTDMGL